MYIPCIAFLISPSFTLAIITGVVEDYPNKTRIAKLLRFKSSNSSDKLTSLDEYIERMRDKQEHIYYMAGSSQKDVCFSVYMCWCVLIVVCQYVCMDMFVCLSVCLLCKKNFETPLYSLYSFKHLLNSSESSISVRKYKNVCKPCRG